MKYTLIYLRSDNIVINTKIYKNWEETANEFGQDYIGKIPV